MHVNFKNQTLPTPASRTFCAGLNNLEQDKITFSQTQQNINQLFLIPIHCSVQRLFALLLWGKAVLLHEQQQHLGKYPGKGLSGIPNSRQLLHVRQDKAAGGDIPCRSSVHFFLLQRGKFHGSNSPALLFPLICRGGRRFLSSSCKGRKEI